MKLTLLTDEIALLKLLEIDFNPDKDYTKDEAIELMEKLYDKENALSRETNERPNLVNENWKLADQVGILADKINHKIPN